MLPKLLTVLVLLGSKLGRILGPLNKPEVWAWEKNEVGDLCQKVSFIVS